MWAFPLLVRDYVADVPCFGGKNRKSLMAGWFAVNRKFGQAEFSPLRRSSLLAKYPRMAFVLDVRSNISSFLRNVDPNDKWRIPYVMAAAMTKTAYEAKDEEGKVMAKVFDRPTRFTLNSLFVKGANKNNLTAIVEFREGFGSIPAWRYLSPQVMGGGRKHKSHEKRLIAAGLMMPTEYAMPGLGIKLDAHGNMPGSILNRILSDLGARSDPQQNTTARSRKRNRSKNRGRYLALRQGHGARPGIYHRTGTNNIVPVLVFVRSPRYEKRFPFYETAQRIMQLNFAKNFRHEWQRSLARKPTRKAA